MDANIKKAELLDRLAKYSNDLQHVREVDEQITHLEKLGLFDRRGYALQSPLGRTLATPNLKPLANVRADSSKPDVV